MAESAGPANGEGQLVAHPQGSLGGCRAAVLRAPAHATPLIGTLREVSNAKKHGKVSAYKHVFEDPCRKLQKMMGHASFDQTLVYLEILADNDTVTDDAAALFEEEILLHEVNYDEFF
jgi:hypothetical protein